MSVPDDPILAWWKCVQMLLLEDWPMQVTFNLREARNTLVLRLEAAPGATLQAHRDGSVDFEGDSVCSLWVAGLFGGEGLLFHPENSDAWEWSYPP